MSGLYPCMHTSKEKVGITDYTIDPPDQITRTRTAFVSVNPSPRDASFPSFRLPQVERHIYSSTAVQSGGTGIYFRAKYWIFIYFFTPLHESDCVSYVIQILHSARDHLSFLLSSFLPFVCPILRTYFILYSIK